MLALIADMVYLLGLCDVRAFCALLVALCEVVRLGSCFRGCAFPLVVLSRLKFSLVLAFWLLVGVLVMVMRLNAIISDFKGLGG